MGRALSFAFIKLSIKWEGRVPHLYPQSSPPAFTSHGAQGTAVGNDEYEWWVAGEGNKGDT